MRSPRISVVIPLYNKAPYVARAVRSVLTQSVEELEVIVVDDGSSDCGGLEVRGIGDPRIRFFRQENLGVSAARNRGIAEARADLIAFLDADDVYNPGLLDVLLGLAAKYPSAGAYGAGFEVILEDGRRERRCARRLRAGGLSDSLLENYFEEIMKGSVLWTSATVVPRRAFDDVGVFPVGAPTGEDIDLWIRIGARYPVAVSSFIGSVYHREAKNRIDDGRYKGVEYEFVRTGLRLLESSEVSAERRRHLAEYIARYQIQTGFYLVLRGQSRRAREVLLECRTRRAVLKKWWWVLWTFVPTRITAAAEKLARNTVWPSVALPELEA